MEEGITLTQHDNLVRSPKHQPQRQCQLLEASTHPVWAEDENAQEHQQYEQVLSCPSVKIKDTRQYLVYCKSDSTINKHKKMR